MPIIQPPLHLTLVGAFELRRGDVPVPVLPSAQRLVAFVALNAPGSRRSTVRSVLWGDVGEQRGNSCLRSALWRTPSPDGRPLLEATHTHLRLNSEVEVDLRRSVSAALALVDRPASDAGTDGLGTQLRQFGGDLLPDWDDAWVRVERERFRQLRLHALEALCERLADRGSYALALEAGLAAVASDPLRESAQRLVVRTHLMEGNVAEALRQHRQYAELLARELGTSPSPSMERLVRTALGQLTRPVPPSMVVYPVGAGRSARSHGSVRVPS